MAGFLYRAVDAEGRSRKGVVEAASEAGARTILRERALLPVSIEATGKPAPGDATAATPGPFAGMRPALNARGLTLASRQLSTLLGAGVRIEEALSIVARQAASPKASTLLLNVRAGVLDGKALAEAMAEFPASFPEFFRASIAAGEKSGRLADVVAHLAEFVEMRQRNRQKVNLALLYPSLLAVVSIGIIVLLRTYVVPDITRVFASRGADLPGLTRGLIAVSDGLNRWGWGIALGIVGGIAALRVWMRIPRNREAFHRALLSNPVTRRVSTQSNAAQFAGTLATLVQSGVPLLDSLKTAANVTPNLHIREKIVALTAKVREGVSLRVAVAEAEVFPPMLVAMVASGETSSDLGPTLARAAADQQRELDAWVTTLVALIEPAVLLILGGLVLMMVMSILLPIVGLNDLAGL